MSKKRFVVSISPEDVMKIVKDRQDADLIHEEFIHITPERGIGTLVFEKYYFRVKNRVALVIIVDNLSDRTDVRTISTGSSEGLFLNFDWGASGNFAESVKEILEDFITEVLEIDD